MKTVISTKEIQLQSVVFETISEDELKTKEVIDASLPPLFANIRKILNLTENCLNEKKDFHLLLITLQITISKVFNLVYSLQAGILTLYDILDYNKSVEFFEIQNFFILMEVYGSGTELNLQNSSIDDNLAVLRLKSANILTQIVKKLQKKISR